MTTAQPSPPTDQATSPSADASPAGDFADQRKSIATFRSAIQWAIASVGAIGALLVSSIPLADLGAVEGYDAFVAGGGILLVVGGILAIIVTAVAGLRPRAVRFSDLPGVRYRHRRTWRHPFRSVEVRAKLATQRRVSTSKRDVLDIQYHECDDPVEELRIDRANTQRKLIQIADERGSKKQYQRDASMLRAINDQLSRIAWIQRYEMQRALYRNGVLVTVLGVFAIAAGMTALLWALHDDDEAAKTAADIAKIEAETRKLDAETAKIEAETAQLLDEQDDTDETSSEPTGELPWRVEAGGDVVIAEGDVSIGVVGRADCGTTSVLGIEQLERRVAAVTLVLLAENNQQLGLDNAGRNDLGQLLRNTHDDLDDLQRWLQERYGSPSDGAVAICGDWQPIAAAIIESWATELSIDDNAQLRQEVMNQLAGRFRSVLGDIQVGALATATVIVENEITTAAAPVMD